MTSLEIELKKHLLGDDEDRIRSTLRRYFQPAPRFSAPMFYDWIPRPEFEAVLGDASGGLYDRASRWMIDLANAADAKIRQCRFDRRRKEHPDWPVVVCEGDSWISHPMVDELGDHLFDDDLNSFVVLNRGAAGDRLVTVAEEREHEAAFDQFDVSALVLSGGGNDLLVQFGEFLERQAHRPGSVPASLVTLAVEARIEELMALMRRVLEGVRARDATVPILVHGYDYMRVAAPRRGKFLGLHFDDAGIEDADSRQATLAHIVDRYNEHLQRTVAEVPGVDYVDFRGLVPDSEWYDEIHPDGIGFRRLAEVLGERVRARVRERSRGQ